LVCEAVARRHPAFADHVETFDCPLVPLRATQSTSRGRMVAALKPICFLF
jgi:hypothetical protein